MLVIFFVLVEHVVEFVVVFAEETGLFEVKTGGFYLFGCLCVPTIKDSLESAVHIFEYLTDIAAFSFDIARKQS